MLDNPFMRPPIRGLRWVRSVCAFLAFAGSLSTAATAGPGPELGSLRAQFPTASIDSVERADAALAATAGAKGKVEKDYKSDAQGCAKTFLVNDCLDRARELQRKRLDEITAVELEANRFKRKDRADRTEADRARREAERTGNQKTDDAQRARNRENFDSKQAQAKRDEAAKTKSTQDRKPAAKRTPPPVPGNDAAQRAKNAAAHASKVGEAKTHRTEIDRRVAAKAADRKRRAEEKAAKDAKTAVPVKP